MGTFWQKSWGWLRARPGGDEAKSGPKPKPKPKRKADAGSDIPPFQPVQEAETEAINERRKVWFENGEGLGPGAPHFGIGLSGGGIRSASFCLGALQALDAFGMVRRADYLSTVSGGGYIGTGMVAAMTRNAAAAERAGMTPSYSFPYTRPDEKAEKARKSEESEEAGEATHASKAIKGQFRDNEAVSHIRDHSNYLIPHGISDIILSLCVVARGIAVNLVLVLLVIVPLAAITILTNPTVGHLGTSILEDILVWANLRPNGWPGFLNGFPLSKIGLAALVALLIGWGAFRSAAQGWSDTAVGWGIAITRLIGALTLAGFVLELQGPILTWLYHLLEPGSTSRIAIPSVYAMLAAFVAATASFRTQLIGWVEKGVADAGFGTLIRSIFSRLLLLLAGLVLPFLIYVAYLGISLWGIACIGTFDPAYPEGTFPLGPAFISDPRTTCGLLIVFGALAAIHAFVLLWTEQGRSTLRLFWKRLLALRYKLPLCIALLLIALAFLALAACATRGTGRAAFPSGLPAGWRAASGIVLWNYILASGTVVLAAFFFSANANSLHGLYRDRLSVAFRLGIIRKGESIVRPMRLSELTPFAPYLIVNATLNARVAAETQRTSASANVQAAAVEPAGSDIREPRADPVRRGRKAEFFHFSRHYIGSDSTDYAETKNMEDKDRDLTLPAATAMSGAAFSSNMGRANIDALSPTLALLNVRLGYWLDNPKYGGKTIADLPADLPWHDFFRSYLAAEAFGLLRTDSSKIYITDGGHVDNLGLYQLLRRRCSVILIIDAEADPAMNFGALVDVERFARIDLGFRIRIDFSAMQAAAARRKKGKGTHAPSTDPVHADHFAIGDIDYGENHPKGTLIYIKALVTGDEPDYVLDYERRYPSFPHETTGDQFFSEEQMEAYRALGFHALERALTTADDPDGDGHPPAEPPSPSDHERQMLAREKIRNTKLGLGIDCDAIGD